MMPESPFAAPFSLRTLGAFDLRDAAGRRVEPVLAQPKRAALLVRIALAGPDGVSRDQLVTSFWPELDDARARNALRQSVHFLRRHLGADAVTSTDERVVVARDVVGCDAIAFAELHAHGDWAGAVAAWTGPCCEALHVADAPGFTEWLDAERQRLGRLAADATERLPGADIAARMRPSRRWMAWAVAAALAIVTVGALVRTRPASAAATATTRIAILPFDIVGDARLGYLREGMVDLLGTRLDGLAELRVVDARTVLQRVAQTPGDVTDEAGALRMARAVGATHAVVGRITTVGTRVELVATLIRTDGRREGVVRATAPGESALFGAVDDIARQLVTLRGVAGPARMVQIAALTTSSLTALRSWLDGERAFRGGRYGAAIDAFERAVALDSTFALAHYRYSLATAAGTAGRSNVSRASLPIAIRHSERLSPHDRLMVRALWEAWYGSPVVAEAMYREALASRADDAEAWYGLGDVIYHTGPWKGRALADARVAFARALALDSTYLEPVQHLARIAAVDHDLSVLATLARREATLLTPGAVPGEAAWLDATARGDEPAIATMAGALAGARDEIASDYAWKAASMAGNPVVGIRILAPRAGPDQPPATRALAMLAIAHFEMARARPAAAAAWIDRAREITPVMALLTEAALVQEVALTPAALRMSAERLARWTAPAGPGDSAAIAYYATPSFARRHLAATLALASGSDPAMAERHVLELEQTGAKVTQAQYMIQREAAGARARLLLARGDTSGALALLDRHAQDDVAYASVATVHAADRLLRARLLAARGRPDQALTLLGSIPEDMGFDAALIPDARLLRAELLAKKGDAAAAGREVALVLAAWRDAEPGERSRVDVARRLAQRLDAGTVTVATRD